MKSLRSGTMIALAAASLFAAACSNKTSEKRTNGAAGEQAAKVHCQGVNECKGHGACKSAANACAGQNGCKGKGFVEVATDDECKTRGGTPMAAM